MPDAQKPPLGLTPRHLVRQRRMQDILAAMGRYLEIPNFEIPMEWVEELHSLVDEENMDRKAKGGV